MRCIARAPARTPVWLLTAGWKRHGLLGSTRRGVVTQRRPKSSGRSRRDGSRAEQDEYAPYEPFDYALTSRYSSKRDPRRYRALVELGASAGDPLAQYAMATWYMHGEPDLRVSADMRRAVKLLKRSARTLNRAMYDLAICKLNGIGTRTDTRGAYQLFRRAAELGCITALDAQAWCLENGEGVRRDLRAARRLDRTYRRLSAALRRLTRRTRATRR
jgi:TPR repeat protein